MIVGCGRCAPDGDHGPSVMRADTRFPRIDRIPSVPGIETHTTVDDESAFGACLPAATASGRFVDQNEAVATCVHREGSFRPNPQAAEVYDGAFECHRSIAAFFDRASRAA